MTVITVAGMIGSGKTSLTDLIANEFNYTPVYEDVEGNDTLELFYVASDEEKQVKRLPFLLQLDFLNSRFTNMKSALTDGEHAVMDRSVYEDEHFARVLTNRGEISEPEFKLYQKLLHNMMEELEELPKKAPDLLVHIRIPFELTLERIGLRGRDFEQDEGLIEYYHDLWKSYDNWVDNHYTASHVVVIDAEKYDFVNSEQDRAKVLSIIEDTYLELGIDY